MENGIDAPAGKVFALTLTSTPVDTNLQLPGAARVVPVFDAALPLVALQLPVVANDGVFVRMSETVHLVTLRVTYALGLLESSVVFPLTAVQVAQAT